MSHGVGMTRLDSIMMVNEHSEGVEKKFLMREWTARAPYHGVEDWLSARDILTLGVCIVLGVIVR